MVLRTGIALIGLAVAALLAGSCGQDGVSEVGADNPGVTTTLAEVESPIDSNDTDTGAATETDAGTATGTGTDGDPGTDDDAAGDTDGVSGDDEAVADEPATVPGEIAQLRPEVLAEYPHDRDAFTQGLVYAGQGQLYESTGLRGRSSVRRVDLATGAPIQNESIDDAYFGEGLERVGDRLVQLTWQANLALVYDADTLEQTGTFPYDTEGWGLCLDNQNRFVMSDGTSTLTFRDPTTFDALGTVEVTQDGQPLAMLNELECVQGLVYANVWLTDTIVEIDPTTGEVIAVIDASGLLTEAEAQSADVLNGIAYRPETETFLITGKLWPVIFEVQFR